MGADDISHDEHRLLTSVYRDVATYISEQGIVASVTNGVDPITGVIGRDLDMMFADQRRAIEVCAFAQGRFLFHGFLRATVMHPLWGPRCIGIHPSTFGEVHAAPTLRLGFLDLGRAVRINPLSGPLGLPFDPTLMLFKFILKRNRSIMLAQPLWQETSLRDYLRGHQRHIHASIEDKWPTLARLCEQVLADDTPGSMHARRLLLLRAMAETWWREPGHTARSFLRQIKRKVQVYFSPCVPYVSVSTQRSPAEVHDTLTRIVGHAFMRIEVRDRPWSWAACRKMQGYQHLAVHVARSAEDLDTHADVAIVLPDDEGQDDWNSMLVEEILDGVMAMNQRWRESYGAH